MHKTALLVLFVPALGLSFAAAASPAIARQPQSADSPARQPVTPRGASSVVRSDVDGDGSDELLLIHPSGRATLVRVAEGGLEPIERAFDGGALANVATAAFADYDANGTQDLVVVGRAGGVRLFAGDGTGSFGDATTSAGIEPIGEVLEAQWQDLDDDGRPDLVMTTHDGFAVARNLRGVFAIDEIDAPGASDVHVERVASGAGPVSGVLEGKSSEIPARIDDALPPVGTRTTPHSPPALPASRPVSSSVDAEGGTGTSASPSSATVDSATFLGSGMAGGCATSLLDALNGGCLDASTTPTLGLLYPLSQTLNVTAANRVGIGTTTPAAKLGIDAVGESALRASSDSGISATIETDVTNLPALFVEAPVGGRSSQFMGQLEVGYRLSGMFPIPVSVLYADVNHNGGRLRGINSLVNETFTLEASEAPGNGARLLMRLADGTPSLELDAESGSESSVLSMNNRAGVPTVQLAATDSRNEGAHMQLSNGVGTDTILFDADVAAGSKIEMRKDNGATTVEIESEKATGLGGRIVVRRADGTPTIVLDGESGTDGRITTDVIVITGGSDLVEGFASSTECAPGSVVVIDDEQPGAVTLSTVPYDSRVCGVVSGAGGVKPGLTMGQENVLDGDTKVALTGRVYVRCSTENGPIRPGQLLTTSSTEGVAMRATDPERSFGTVIGKAMGALDEGEGLVLVLVNLQ